jgi:hypothetical protein
MSALFEDQNISEIYMSGKLIINIAVACLAFAGSTKAQTLGIDFTANQNTDQGNAVTGTAGVVAQANWNNVNAGGAATGSSSSLLYSDGSAASGVSVSWSAPDTYSANYALNNGNETLLSNFLDSTPATGSTVSITGLSGGTYDLYIYIAGDQGSPAIRGGTYDINGTAFTLYNNGTADSANGDFSLASGDGVTAGNYFETTITGTSLTVTTTATHGTDSFLRAPIDGLQLVAVPEPSTWAMMLGGVGMLGIFRRRRA